MKRKRRSIAASRAASLKGWRVRKKYPKATQQDIDLALAKIREASLLIHQLIPTIERIPKVEW